MPYIHVRVTDNGLTEKQKSDIIKGTTDVMVDVLNKSPESTYVIIEEVSRENWGVGGMSVKDYSNAKQ